MRRSLGSTCLLLVCLNVIHAGNLYVSSYQNTQIFQYGGNSGALLDTGNPYGPIVAAGTTLNGPELLTFGPDGSLWVASFNNGQVLRFEGNSGTLLATYTTGDGTEPTDLTFGPDGTLYVALLTNVVRLNPGTGAFVPFATVGAPFGIRFGPDGNLYAATGENNVQEFAGPFAVNPGAFLNNVANVSGPNGLTFGPDGSLYVASFATDSIVKITNPGGASPVANTLTTGSSGTANDLNSPVGLTFGPDGFLYAASSGSNEILRYDPNSGAFLGAFIPAGLGGLVDPEGLAFGPDSTFPGDEPFVIYTLFQN